MLRLSRKICVDLLNRNNSFLNMNGQKKISNFFTPSSKKPCNKHNNNITEQNDEPAVKKAKITEPEDEENIPSTPPDAALSPSPLSPEQKKRMEDNRLQAEIKLIEKKTNGLVVNFGTSWYKALKPEFTKEYFLKLSEFVAKDRKQYTIFPPPNLLFSWTEMSDLQQLKVVILGQDPYHGPGQAHGLCFSVQKGVPPPPSLVNMYKELINDIEGFKHPGHGDLTGWAQQGVLLLNACLTVRQGQANSHKDKGWEKFTDAVVQYINTNMKDVVFILWGSYAQKKGARIDKKKHCVLKGVHPSPLSAHRGFFGCKHFSQCNEYLKEHHKKPIDWTHLPKQ